MSMTSAQPNPLANKLKLICQTLEAEIRNRKRPGAIASGVLRVQVSPVSDAPDRARLNALVELRSRDGQTPELVVTANGIELHTHTGPEVDALDAALRERHAEWREEGLADVVKAVARELGLNA